MHPPDNARFSRALNDLLDSPSTQAEIYLRPLLEQLTQSTLIVGRDGDELSVFETEDDEIFLALFTDLVDLHLFAPGSRWEAIGGEDVIRRVAAGEYDGLVVNPGPRSFELTREDVIDMFEIDPSR